MNTEKSMSSVAAAVMVGLIISRMPVNICLGRVRCSGLATNSTTTTSSNEVTKANSAPEMTPGRISGRSEEHTSELQSLMRNSYAVFCLKKKNHRKTKQQTICMNNT